MVNEIGGENNMQNKMPRHYLLNSIFGVVTTFMIYTTTLLCLQSINNIPIFNNQKIESQKQLEKAVKEEALKLNLDTSKIEARYNAKHTAASKEGEEYILGMTGVNATRKNVKHELYHILKDLDKEDKHDFMHYFFIQEPRASIYGTFGLKL
jgi:hypothetical protein